MSKSNFNPASLGDECKRCNVTIPKAGFKSPVLRKHLHFNSKGNITLLCSDCKPSRKLSDAWILTFGNTNIDGFPVDSKKKNTILSKAVGFRRTSFVDGKKVTKYVRR